MVVWKFGICFFGQGIPKVTQLNLYIGETGAGSIAGFSEITGWRVEASGK